MKRTVFAVVGGLVAWVLIVSLVDRGLRLAMPGYEAAEPDLAFTLPMMIARLAEAVITSLAAGAVTRAIAPASARAPWIVGGIMLLLFLPQHVRIWAQLPAWYHLLFLITLAPLVVLGARIRLKSTPAAP